jgi:hypothetical protein
MSYFDDRRPGPPQWSFNTPFDTEVRHSSYGVYGSPYGPTSESEQLRQQNADKYRRIHQLGLELDSMKYRGDHAYMSGPQPLTGASSNRTERLRRRNTVEHFDARFDSYPGSPFRSERLDHVRQGQRNGYLGDHYISGSDMLVQNSDHVSPRFNENLLAGRHAVMRPAAYLEPIIAQDNLRLWRSQSPAHAEAAPRLEAADFSEDMPSRKLIHALDEHYRLDLMVEPGRRFDNVDDTIIATYINARDITTHQEQVTKLIITGGQQWPALNSWSVHIPFLQLPYTVLEVELPIDPEAITDVNNDVLRVLYVHLSNDSPSIPSTVSDASVTASRRHVLSELERRGFAATLPRVTRFRGRNNGSAYRKSTALKFPGIACSPKLAKTESIDQFSKEVRTEAASETLNSKNSDDNEPCQQVGRGSVLISRRLFGEGSVKKKGKAAITRDYETDSSGHWSTVSSLNTAIYELEDSSSEDGTPRDKGKAPATDAFSRDESGGKPENTKPEPVRTPAKHRNSLSDQKSDY